MKKKLEGVMGNWLTHKSTPRSRDGKMGQNFLTQPVWLVTRLTRLKMTRFDLWLVLTRDSIDSTRTQPDPPILQCLPTLSRLRLKCNSYKIFTYSSLLNMLCTPLLFVILYLPPLFYLPTLNKSKIIPRLTSRKLE